MTQQSDEVFNGVPVPIRVGVLEVHIVRRLHGRIRDVHVTRKDDGLVLHGRVRTYYDKQLAQHALLEAADAPLLANTIEVV